MTALDPHRTLGLNPGASQAEIKSAYRHLAKLYHPDSAGERALPRFLAIQAAYETLVDDPTRPRGTTRSDPGARAAGPPPPAWQADASRARATREAYRARTRRGEAAPAASGGAGRTADPGPATGRSTGPRTTGGRSPGRSSASGDEAAPAGGSASAGGSSARPAGPGSGTKGGGRSGRSARRTKATIGSTSYDGADREPFDPAWEGATWYGAGSGTYWTLNPKEYADPRKHGPEYLARSRRATSGSSTRSGSGAGSATDEAASEPNVDGPATDTDATRDAPGPRPRPAGRRQRPAEPDAAQPAIGSRPRPSEPTPGAADGGVRSRRASAETSAGDGAAAPVPAASPAETAWQRAAPGPDAFPNGGGSGPSLLRRLPSTPLGRVILALVGWIPIGVGLAAVTDALPACGVGIVSVCADPLRAGIWPVHVLLLGVLAAVPRLAAIAVSGTVVFLAVGLAATPVLIVIGGAQSPTGNPTVLAIILLGAWFIGVGLAVAGRVDLPPWRGRRVR